MVILPFRATKVTKLILGRESCWLVGLNCAKTPNEITPRRRAAAHANINQHF